MKYILNISLFALLSINVYASKEVGNGGFGIICNDNDVLESLDLYEARKRYGFVPSDILSEDINYELIIKKLLSVLKGIDPNRVQSYLYQLKNFNDNTQDYNVPGIILSAEEVRNPEIQKRYNLGVTNIPQNCQLSQIAYQNPATSQGSYVRNTIYLPNWNKLDEVQKAAIVLHEIVYREFLLMENSVAQGVRHIVGLLMSEDFKEFNEEEWLIFINQYGLLRMFPKFSFYELDDIEPAIWRGILTRPWTKEKNVYYVRASGKSAWPKGKINICNRDLDVEARPTESYRYLKFYSDGQARAYGSAIETQILDLSCQVKNGLNLKIVLSSESGFKMDKEHRNVICVDNKFFDKKYSILSSLDHPRIKWQGPVISTINMDRYYGDCNDFDSSRRILTIFNHQFSSIKVLNNKNEWVEVERLKLDLDSSEILNYK